MWSLIFSGLAWFLSLFGFGKSKSDVGIAHETGEAQGKAEAAQDGYGQELRDIETAKQAADDTALGLATGNSKLREPDKFQRKD